MSLAESTNKSTLDRWWHSVDKIALLVILALSTLGMILSFSANLLNTSTMLWPVLKQAVILIVALGCMCWLSFSTPVQVRRIGIVIFLIGLLLMAGLPFFGSAYDMGAVRWYSLGGFSFQPSEFFKPGFVIIAAWLISARYDPGPTPPGTFLSMLLLILSAGLLIIQPDFGQTALITIVWSIMFFVSGVALLWIIIAGIGIIGSSIAAYMHPSLGHVRDRIAIFVHGDPDPYSQVSYAHKAIVNGGLTGVGPGNGEMVHHLADSNTDYIMALAAEEYGLLICLPIIALFGFLVLRSLGRVIKSNNVFVQIAGTGLSTLIGIQAFINIAVAVRLAPAKGMTLPLISQGGSSLIAVGITLGLLLALTQEESVQMRVLSVGNDKNNSPFFESFS